MTPARRRLLRANVIAAALACAAPTVGDVGGCGQEAVLLDAEKFFARKQSVDCAQCTECGLATRSCVAACGFAPVTGAFPEGCFPLVHDGRVCLNALEAASCDDFAAYVADEGATIPTECEFCPVDAEGAPDPDDEGGS